MKGLDFEATNRCNANCHFCPRDATPHQGLMSMETFEYALGYAHMVREASAAMHHDIEHITLCGLGEPTLNPKLPKMVARIREEGFMAKLGSNGSLLDERRTNKLLDAGLQEVSLNIGETGEEYEKIYELPWQTTIERVEAFIKAAEGRCNIRLVLVDHRGSRKHLRELQQFWRDRGVDQFTLPPLGNRGGALEVDDMDFLNFPELADAEAIMSELSSRPICGVPFQDRFVGYDGYLYLCCQDWKKEAPVGHVSDPHIEDVVRKQLEFVRSRAVVCKTCKLEPTNRLVAFLRDVKSGHANADDQDQFMQQLDFRSHIALALAQGLAPGLDVDSVGAEHSNRTLIPVATIQG